MERFSSAVIGGTGTIKKSLKGGDTKEEIFIQVAVWGVFEI